MSELGNKTNEKSVKTESSLNNKFKDGTKKENKVTSEGQLPNESSSSSTPSTSGNEILHQPLQVTPSIATISCTVTNITPPLTSATIATTTTTGTTTITSTAATVAGPNSDPTIDCAGFSTQSLNVSSPNMVTTVGNVSSSRGRSLSALAPLRLTRSIQNSSWRENLSNNWSSVIQEFRPVFQAHNTNRAIIANLSNYRVPSSSSNFRYIDSPTSDTNQQYASDSYVINLDTSGASTVGTTAGTGIIPNHNYRISGRPSISESVRTDHHSHLGGNGSDGNDGGHHHYSHHSQTVRSDTEDSGADPGDVPAEADLSETLAQIPEAANLLNTLSKYVPYLCILLAKSCFDHLDGILVFFALFVTFYHANKVVRQEVTKQNQRRKLPLLRELLYIILVVAVVGFMLERNSIPISFLLAIPLNLPEPFTLKSLMFAIAINDLILKLITVAIKIMFTLLPPLWVDYKGRGRIYLMIESFSQLYRALVTTHPWLLFLLDSYEGTEKIMGVILSGAYIVAKGTDLLQRLKFVKQAFIKLLQKVSFGTVPTKEQIQDAGGICTICHDNFNSPVMLGKHVSLFTSIIHCHQFEHLANDLNLLSKS